MKGSQYLNCDDGLMVCIYIKTYQIVYFIICQLHLKKAVWIKSRNKDAKQYHILFIYAADKCSVVSNSATPWTAALQAPLSMEYFQARILEWVAISFSRYLYTFICRKMANT